MLTGHSSTGLNKQLAKESPGSWGSLCLVNMPAEIFWAKRILLQMLNPNFRDSRWAVSNFGWYQYSIGSVDKSQRASNKNSLDFHKTAAIIATQNVDLLYLPKNSTKTESLCQFRVHLVPVFVSRSVSDPFRSDPHLEEKGHTLNYLEVPENTLKPATNWSRPRCSKSWWRTTPG